MRMNVAQDQSRRSLRHKDCTPHAPCTPMHNDNSNPYSKQKSRRGLSESACGDDDFKAGDKVLVDQFKPKEKVDVIGVSKGRGFAGVVKRHHFRGGEGSHGSMFHRAPGSIGASSFPSRVLPGMRMGGYMGSEQVTVRNL